MAILFGRRTTFLTFSSNTDSVGVDGFGLNTNAGIGGHLGRQAHYGQIVKTYAAVQDKTRYSPAACTGCKKKKIPGNPVKKNISTSMVERQNLMMRRSMRRFTRLTNGFSKKWENLQYMLAIYFAYYNFCRSHKTLDNATPAMASNLTKTIWSLKDLLNAAKDDHAPLDI